MILNEYINKTNFFYTDSHNHTGLCEYYNMICKQLKKVFYENDFPYDVNFGNEDSEKEINLDFQYEHTIVKKNNTYQHNVYRYDYLNKMDCIFEYTETNIHFLSGFEELSDYVKKIIYLPALIYDDIPFSEVKNRELDFTTLHSWSERRAKFYNKRIHHNIDGSFDKLFLKKKLDKFKVLLNIHQIDEHKSFEELRVLPALSTGILVISEDVPYKDSIPYNNHIIWSSYEDLDKTLNEVLNNYDHYREEKLSGLSKTLEEMKKNSEYKLLNFFKNI